MGRFAVRAAGVLLAAVVSSGLAAGSGWIEPGSALRAALQVREQGDADAALAALAKVAERYPIVADYAGWLEASWMLDAGQAEEAAAAARRTIARSPDSSILPWLYRLLGDARFALDQDEQAKAAWETALAMTREREETAPLRLALGGVQERAGREEAAAREYRALWVKYPTSPEAERADQRLAALEQERGEPLRTARDFLRRGDRLFAANRNEAALAAYDRALRGTLDPKERLHARERRAHTMFRMRRYSEAAGAFRELGEEGDARFWWARSLARSGRVEAAIGEFERLAASAQTVAIRARYLAALLLDGEDETLRANAHYEQLTRQKQDPELAAAASWHLGWLAFRAGRFEEAREHMAQLEARLEDPIERLRARYWGARALGALDAEGGRAELVELGHAYPFSYYGWRAAQRSGANGSRPAREAQTISRGTNRLADRELARVRILLEAGLDDAARRELRGLARRARGLDDRLELARLNAEAGDFHRAERLVVDAYAETLARGPVPGLEELWWLAWPDAYGRFVDRAVASEGAVERELVYAVMREESGYRPEVVSAAGALGLLQIMPTTGERLARQLGQAPLASDDLFRPDVNLRLGGFYLGRLKSRFHGNLSAAIASYNAGPEAVARWLEASPLEDDVWVESIPYQQTRGYVRRVLRSLHVYRTLY